jgi:hypothetical protein
MPKNLKGQGLKDTHLFAHLLARRSRWRLSHNEYLWGRIMKTRYLCELSIEDWFR